jgi:uncharacterized membrane protein
MADVPVQVIVAAFQDPNGASAALDQLKEAQSKGLIRIEDAAVLHKDEYGKLHMKETADMGGGKGAAIGGVIGGVIGIIAGPAGVVVGAAAGAAIGGLAAKLTDAGFPDERLRQVGAGLKPNTSAIVAVIDHVWVAEAERQLQQAGADTVTAAISADIAKQLAAGKDVAYSAVGTAEAVGITRMAAGGDEAEVSDIVATKDAIYMDDVTKVKDDVTATAAVITADGAAAIQATGKLTPEGTAPASTPPAQVEAPKAEAPKTDTQPSTPSAAASDAKT